MGATERPCILQFGVSGQVAYEAIRLADRAGVEVRALDRVTADLTDPDAIYRTVMDAPARVCAVLNAAAYTAVDAAEADPGTARLVNAAAPAAMAAACAERGLNLLHISTDYVFDGEKPGPYAEDDPVNPLGVYGRTKLEGERAVLDALPDAVILRTSWVFSAHGKNFVRTMIRLAGERDRLSVVDDQRGGPTPAAAIADAALTILSRLNSDPGRARGVFHFAGAPAVSWKGFAEAIFARMAAAGRATPALAAITTDQYPTPAARPKNSILNCSRIQACYGIAQPDWRAALDRDVSEILETGKHS